MSDVRCAMYCENKDGCTVRPYELNGYDMYFSCEKCFILIRSAMMSLSERAVLSYTETYSHRGVIIECGMTAGMLIHCCVQKFKVDYGLPNVWDGTDDESVDATVMYDPHIEYEDGGTSWN